MTKITNRILQFFLSYFGNVFIEPISTRQRMPFKSGTGQTMKKIAAILIATTALAEAVPALAGVYVPQPQTPFIWTDPAPAQTAPKSPAKSGEQNTTSNPLAPASSPAPNSSVEMLKPYPTPAAHPDTSKSVAPAKTPLLKDYPTASALQHRVPADGSARYLSGDCPSPTGVPGDSANAKAPQPHQPDAGKMTPEMKRRGVTTGDDGILEAIQTDPCTIIYRRGGETPASRAGYTDPHDIRRANTLEDHRIPIAPVGRYEPKDSGTWYHDSNNPYVDTAQTWKVEQGEMLSQMLTGWAKRAGWTVIWNSPSDYVVQTNVDIHATFPDAFGQVIAAFANANPPISADMYPANHVAVVKTASQFDGR